MLIPLSWSLPKSEFWPLESILNQNQNKICETESAHKKKKKKKKKNPPDLIDWTRHTYTTTAANQNEAANALEARTFTVYPAKRNDLEKAVHYLAAPSDDNKYLPVAITSLVSLNKKKQTKKQSYLTS